MPSIEEQLLILGLYLTLATIPEGLLLLEGFLLLLFFKYLYSNANLASEIYPAQAGVSCTVLPAPYA